MTVKHKILYFAVIVLIISAGQLYGQSHGSMQNLTLDETLNKLFPPDKNANKGFRWDPLFQEGSFSLEGHFGAFQASLTAGKEGFFLLDNWDLYATPLPFLENGELLFPEQFVNTVQTAFGNSISQDSSYYRITAIVIDPGHGGKDPGGESHLVTINGKETKILDKDIALKASLFLRDLLIKRYPDKRILMTRESDITLTLEERTDMANSVPIRKNEAVIYISLHANAMPNNKKARGYEVYYLNPEERRNVLDSSSYNASQDVHEILNRLTEEAYISESIRIASAILDSLNESMGKIMPSRGLKSNNFFVVKNSRMPAVLVELGFLTNADDLSVLLNDSLLHKLSQAVYKGIEDFITDFERSGGFISTP